MIKQAFRLIYVEESKAHSYEIFLISLLLIIIVCIAGNFEDLQIMLTQPGNCYAETIFCYLAQTGFLIPLTMLISAFCSSTMFIRDKLTGFIRFIVLRIPLHTYAIARAWECFLKAFLCIFISAIIPLVALLMILPGNSFWLSMYIIIDYAIAVAFWCLSGLFMSTFVQNYYVAIVGPFVLSYIVGRLCYAFLPDVCNPNNYMQAYLFSLVANDDQWIICARSLLLFGTLSIIIGIAFVWRIERKIPNEI